MKLAINPSHLLPEIWNMLLVLLFGYAAFSKLYEHLIFYQQLEKLPVVGPTAWLLSWILPLVELGISVLLIFPKTRLKGNKFACLILFLFTLYLSLIYIFQADMPCACGGFIENLTWKQHMLFNLFFLILAIFGMHQYKTSIIHSFKLLRNSRGSRKPEIE